VDKREEKIIVMSASDSVWEIDFVMKCKWCGKNTVGRFCKGTSCRKRSESFNIERRKKLAKEWIEDMVQYKKESHEF